MTRWRTTFPKELPKSSKSHIVVAIKCDNGERVEFAGQLNRDDAMRLIAMATEMSSTGNQDQTCSSAL